MNRKIFIDIVNKLDIPYIRIIGIKNSYDIEVKKDQIINRKLFPKHNGITIYLDDKKIYNFEF